MAQVTRVQLVDDIDGTPIAEGEGETLQFAIDGASYEIDLTAANAANLRKSIEEWAQRARRVGGRKATGTRRSAAATQRDYEPKAVRKWAEANKITVPARGRIPAEVVEKYRAAGN